MKLVYIAGPYRALTRLQVEQNIQHAIAWGMEVALAGAYPVIPHANTPAVFDGALPDSFFLEGTLELMRRCDAGLWIPGWEHSSGAREEYRVMDEELHKPCFKVLRGVREGSLERVWVLPEALRSFIDPGYRWGSWGPSPIEALWDIEGLLRRVYR